MGICTGISCAFLGVPKWVFALGYHALFSNEFLFGDFSPGLHPIFPNKHCSTLQGRKSPPRRIPREALPVGQGPRPPPPATRADGAAADFMLTPDWLARDAETIVVPPRAATSPGALSGSVPLAGRVAAARAPAQPGDRSKSGGEAGGDGSTKRGAAGGGMGGVTGAARAGKGGASGARRKCGEKL